MKLKITSRKSQLYLFVIIEIIFLVLCIFVKKPLITTTPFEYDEPDYVANSILLSHFRQYHPDDIYWSQIIAYDQPHLYHYLCGLFLENTYHQPIDQILKNNDLFNSPGNPFLGIGKKVDGKSLDDPFIQTHEKAFRVILSARTLSFIFYFLTGTILISIFYCLKIIGFSPLLLVILLSPYVFSTSIYAISDGLLLLTISLSTLLSILYLRYPKKHFLFIVLLGISCGLALSTKLNGGLTIFTGLLAIIVSIKSSKNIKIHILDTFILLTTSLSVFIFLNPFLYINTFQNIIHIFQYRMYVGDINSVMLPEEALPGSYLNKFIFFSKRIYSIVGLSPTTSFLLIIFSIFASLYIICFYAFNRINSLHRPKLNLLLSSLLTFTIVFLYIPMDWQRYYLPALISNVFLLALDLYFLIKIFGKRFLLKTIRS